MSDEDVPTGARSRTADMIVYACGVAGLIAVLGTFLPWAGATLADRGADLLHSNRSGLELSWHGKVVLGLGILGVVISVLLSEIPRARPFGLALPVVGGAIAVLSAVKINAGDAIAAKLLRLRIGTFQTDNPVVTAEVGLGLWLSLVAGVALVLGGLFLGRSAWRATGASRRPSGGISGDVSGGIAR
ncbi:hypothetical protein [Protofrankia coriariae]|uniref:hypothetical protein n=1 Tax=Protofrankia coriariae TaxID=1562887 RepID=UPI00069A8660|nr:hypothetical protein [Protofrankia coriariae]